MTKSKSPIQEINKTMNAFKGVMKPFVPNVNILQYSLKKRLIIDNKKRLNTKGSENDRTFIYFFSKDEESIAITLNYLNMKNEPLPESMRTAEISIKDHNDVIRSSKAFPFDVFNSKIETLMKDIEKLNVSNCSYKNLDNVSYVIRQHFDLNEVYEAEFKELVSVFKNENQDDISMLDKYRLKLKKITKQVPEQRKVYQRTKAKESAKIYNAEKEKLESLNKEKDFIESKIFEIRNDIYLSLFKLNETYKVPCSKVKNIIYQLFDNPIKA